MFLHSSDSAAGDWQLYFAKNLYVRAYLLISQNDCLTRRSYIILWLYSLAEFGSFCGNEPDCLVGIEATGRTNNFCISFCSNIFLNVYIVFFAKNVQLQSNGAANIVNVAFISIHTQAFSYYIWMLSNLYKSGSWHNVLLLTNIQDLIRRWHTRTWREISSYMITYLPLNYRYDRHVLPEFFVSNAYQLLHI